MCTLVLLRKTHPETIVHFFGPSPRPSTHSLSDDARRVTLRLSREAHYLGNKNQATHYARLALAFPDLVYSLVVRLRISPSSLAFSASSAAVLRASWIAAFCSISSATCEGEGSVVL